MSSGINEAPPDVVDASLDSPTGSTSSLYSQDGTRVRKKWGAAQIPFLAPDGSLKRFLHFGKKSTVGRDLVSEQTRSSRLGYPLQSHDGFSFSEGMSLQEQGIHLLFFLEMPIHKPHNHLVLNVACSLQFKPHADQFLRLQTSI